jgi:predicted ATPase
LEYRSHHTAI